MVAPGFIAIGSGPAGLSAAETFRSKHPHISVRILTTDPALPYAKPPLSKAYLCGREAKLDLHSPGWFVRNDVELIAASPSTTSTLPARKSSPRAGAATPTGISRWPAARNPVPLHVPGAEAALSLRSFADAVVPRMAARSAGSAMTSAIASQRSCPTTGFASSGRRP